MTQARARSILWLTLLLAAPVPFFLVVVGYEPVARLLQILGISLAVIAVEGPGGAIRLIVVILALQILAWAAVLRLIARLAVVGLDRMLGGARVGAATIVLSASLLLVAAVTPIYRTPFRVAGITATLLEVFE